MVRRGAAFALLAFTTLVLLAGTAAAQASDDPGAPSIIGSPHERGTNNFGGLIVGTLLLGGWILGGVLLLRSGRRRRAAAHSPVA